jgi:hypothetical protein
LFGIKAVGDSPILIDNDNVFIRSVVSSSKNGRPSRFD